MSVTGKNPLRVGDVRVGIRQWIGIVIRRTGRQEKETLKFVLPPVIFCEASESLKRILVSAAVGLHCVRLEGNAVGSGLICMFLLLRIVLPSTTAVAQTV
ncbi:hypothetical protein H9W95_17485 [Flavobacterium lindanitolerans]|nr:hypothetical protein [Flavobacterium lindanitolerans]